MANIFDYLKWRGDIKISQSEFNEIDNLILARFAYFPFDNILKEDEEVTIKELGERFSKLDISKEKILQKEDIDFFPEMAKTQRFGEMKATKYVNKIDIKEENQFSAITILMPDNTIYVSYRGTDNTIVGWKDDFNMSFKSHVASQKDSVIYLNQISKEFKNKIRVGGHSKGGNLAVYAATFADKEVKDRIINIYNNDGPGFNEDVTETKEYKSIIGRVNTYIPQESIVGKLLNHGEKYTILRSTQKGIMQHDLYSWQLIGTKFEYLEEVTNGSEFIDKTIRAWLESVSIEEREKFIDIIFEIVGSTNATTLSEIKSQMLLNSKTILTTYKNISPEDKEMISNTISALLKGAKKNLFNTNKNEK